MLRSSGFEPSPSCFENMLWYFDTRVSSHMFRDENIFKELTKVEARHVTFEMHPR